MDDFTMTQPHQLNGFGHTNAGTSWILRRSKQMVLWCSSCMRSTSGKGHAIDHMGQNTSGKGHTIAYHCLPSDDNPILCTNETLTHPQH